MPFIPHTESDIRQMLDNIGVNTIADLFAEIPADLRTKAPLRVPDGMSEMQVTRLMQERAGQDRPLVCFAGAGAYEHHVPAAVWQIATRGEFYTAYTPYQAEASQGTLQLLYEYQTMIASLTGLDAANASLYDGASALAEAVLMAVRANRASKSKRVLLPLTVHPHYRQTVQSIVKNQGIELIAVPYCTDGGNTLPAALEKYAGEDIAALVIPQPNFFGVLEEVDALTDWAHAHGALAVALVNPMALALLSAPGNWGQQGADIACGDGQPLGIPLSSGGPYFGFLCCKLALIRQMPGRIIGRTVDAEGKPGFVLTLQAREQHIRRSKATSNICTNQGLMVTAATLYMSLVGPQGMENTAGACHANTNALVQRLEKIAGVERIFNRPVFHEAVLRLPKSADQVLAALEDQGILGGYALKADYPELGEAILVCATEMRTAEEIEQYGAALARLCGEE